MCALLQISYINIDLVIDAYILRESISTILTPLFANPSIIKLLHGGDTDISLIISDLNIPIINVFDTAWGFREFIWTSNIYFNTPKLLYLTQVLLNKQLDKELAIQEWRTWPLDEKLIQYARWDSHYLLYLFAIMEKMFDPNQEVHFTDELLEQEMNLSWIEYWAKEKLKWSKLLGDFAWKMNEKVLKYLSNPTGRHYVIHHLEN